MGLFRREPSIPGLRLESLDKIHHTGRKADYAWPGSFPISTEFGTLRCMKCGSLHHGVHLFTVCRSLFQETVRLVPWRKKNPFAAIPCAKCGAISAYALDGLEEIRQKWMPWGSTVQAGSVAEAMARWTPLSEVARQQRHRVSIRRCDACGEDFFYSTGTFTLFGKPEPEVVDVGGFCMECRRYLCPRHAGSVPWDIQGRKVWSPSCASCGKPLVGDEVRQRLESMG